MCNSMCANCVLHALVMQDSKMRACGSAQSTDFLCNMSHVTIFWLCRTANNLHVNPVGVLALAPCITCPILQTMQPCLSKYKGAPLVMQHSKQHACGSAQPTEFSL